MEFCCEDVSIEVIVPSWMPSFYLGASTRLIFQLVVVSFHGRAVKLWESIL